MTTTTTPATSTTVVRTSVADVNLLSIAGGITNYNPTADATAGAGQVGVPIPSPLVLTPTNAYAFASLLKVCDGTANLSLGGAGAFIDQGQEGCVDLNNGVQTVTITAEFGVVDGLISQRIVSIKGGCRDITIVGQCVVAGSECNHLIGEYSDQSQAVDQNIDLSATNGPVIIARGLMGYLFGNLYHVTLGVNCSLLFWSSLASWAYVHAKDCYVWALEHLPKSWAAKIDPSYDT